MKKVTSLIIAIAILMCVFPFCSEAYQVGDLIGYALSTDIAATINGYDIPSYNVDGYTYIIAEDLQYYGFSVIYDNNSRSLSISRDPSQLYVSKVYEKPYVLSKDTGIRERKILYTDIVTYLDGNYVPTCNINGQTIIRFDSLSMYGEVLYDNNKREISLALPGIQTNPNPIMRVSEFFNKIQGYWSAGYDFILFEGTEYTYATYCSEAWEYGTIIDIKKDNNNSVTLTVDCPAIIYGYEEVSPKHISTIVLSSKDGFKNTIKRVYPGYPNETATYSFSGTSFDEFSRIMYNKYGF